MIRLFIAFIALVFGLFGLFYLVLPEPLATIVGLSATASGLTDIRATYGGFQIGLALFLTWSLRDAGRYPAAFVAMGVVAAAVAFGRILGVLVDGDLSTFHLVGIVFEVPLAFIAFYLYRQEA